MVRSDATWRFHKRYLALFEELTKPRYRVFTVDQFYHQGQRDPNKVQVILRFDVDAGAGIAYEMADYLHSLGLPASFYFLTRTATYPLDWDRLRDMQAKGFEVGLHSDHYYEQLTRSVDGLSLMKEDSERFRQELGAPVGMVWHGHAGMHQLQKCNWDLYKYSGPEELGLRYHDGVDGPYSYANVATWGPPADIYISDGMQQYLVLWRRYLKVLRNAKPGVTVQLLLHPHRTVEWWKVTLPGETLPPRMTVLDKGKLYVQYGLLGLVRSLWRLATRGLARGLALALYHLARLVVRERKARSELLDAAPVQAHLKLMQQKPDSAWEEKVKSLGFSGLDTVLDLGAGPGRYSVALSRLNRRVVAVEPLKEYREQLEKRVKAQSISNVQVLPCRAEEMSMLRVGTADGVFCNDVLQYTDASAVLGEIRRICRPGATVFVSVPGLGVRLRELSEAVKTGDFGAFNRHFRAIWETFWSGYVGRRNVALFYFTYGRFRNLLERHGFEVEKMFPYQYYGEDTPVKLAGFAYYYGP
ncbi:MAG: methyltransferase domain-containing protein [Dehalococcoidia bacterium]|nr:methyltransferase domain-containing protein [Dehalococcoidia bacterium]